jgi:LPXTG-motif cell wall-anchored protein
MTLRRALTGALLGLMVAAVAPVTAANAAAPAYPPGGTVTIRLSSSVITVGTSVTVTGSGFAANISVSVTVDQSGQGFAGRQADGMAMGSFRPAGAAPAVQRFAATTALAAVTTDGSGAFSTSLTFSQVGVFVVTASGQAADGTTASASGTITVLAAGGAGGSGNGGGAGSGSGGGSGSGSGGGSASGVGGLPNTGASVGLPLTVGAILVLLGAGLVTVFRRRRGNAPA